SLAQEGELGNLDIPVSLSLRLYAWLASSTMSAQLWIPRTLAQHACCRTLHGFLSEHSLLAMVC
ncbi:hypothetical protein Tco_1267588, partial [Tanacetum coccineum]